MKVLFVCLGNICRSPAAEGALRKRADEAGLPLSVDSAGTGSWHVGEPPYRPMIEAAGRRGIRLNDLRARCLRASDFDAFDLIIAMDHDNLDEIERLRPAGNETPARLFLEYAPQAGESDVPDPYYTRDFERALDLIEMATDGLLQSLA